MTKIVTIKVHKAPYCQREGTVLAVIFSIMRYLGAKLLVTCWFSLALTTSAFGSYKFQIFPTEKEASHYLVELFEKYLNQTPAIVEKDNDRISYDRLNRITTKVMSVYRELHPSLVIPTIDPLIVIINSEEMRAQVLNDNEKGETPYFLIISNQFMKLTDEVLIGLIAHELSHLILQWVDEKGIFHPLEYFYHKSVNKNEGLTEKRSISLDKEVKEFIIRNGEEKIMEFPKIDDLRFYNREDHADEVTVSVLKKLNIPIEGYNQFLLDHFYPHGLKCDISTEPAYGPIKDVHHSSCWRVWRNKRIYNK